ncbi:phototropic-responsive NPH3 family protein [Actinidia rufa]|uniref:Phototropic-responsive NPH3 family protein n=1 Tax=Actinidia rufa TaxID=165716 RepID=A0A7J0FXE1_9ERIC|nr:phototropic-responsive NPH3 family protein [Actinidia rufa]
MKFMKLGTRPETFYTEEATRTVISDVPSDVIIKINNISYLLHKHQLLPKCGLLGRPCSNSEDSESVTLELDDIPGGEDAFELCAKFCYEIVINLSAHNIVPMFCAAKILQMTEATEKGNLVLKLEAFFDSCILEGWKDSILTLQTTGKLPEWSQNLGITRRCIDSVVEKVLTPPAKVTWSYTYTRPGYAQKRRQFVPKDWWTEDVSDLDMDLFRCIITAIRSANTLLSQLIASQTEDDVDREKQILETVVSMIPADRGSYKRSSAQFEEATVNDLLFHSHLSSSGGHFYDIDLVGAVLESFLLKCRRQHSGEQQDQPVRLIRKVGKLIDSYLQVVARDVNMPVSKVVCVAEALPEIAQPDHDDVYKAVNIYLKWFKSSSLNKKRGTSKIPPQELLLGRQWLPITRGDPPSKLKVTSREKFREVEDTTIAGIPKRSHHRMAKSDGKLMLGPEQYVSGKEAVQAEEIIDKGRVTLIREEDTFGSKTTQRKTKSDPIHIKGR